jgi:ferredoxin
MYMVTVADTGESFRCGSDETVLQGMERLGRRGIPVGCRQGGCGVCKIQVLSGKYTKRVMSRDHVSVEEEAQDKVLACRIRPAENLTVKVIGKLLKAVTYTRLAA